MLKALLSKNPHTNVHVSHVSKPKQQPQCHGRAAAKPRTHWIEHSASRMRRELRSVSRLHGVCNRQVAVPAFSVSLRLLRENFGQPEGGAARPFLSYAARIAPAPHRQSQQVEPVMGVVVASELRHCAGVPLGSSNMPIESDRPQPQVSDEEAAASAFIPAEGISAVLVSERRVLVTGGVLDDDRVLPFSVIRFLDLHHDPAGDHQWTRPLLLRGEAVRKGKRKRGDTTFPVCRMDHTLTLVRDCAMLVLIGGLKVVGKEIGQPCKTMFAFDVKRQLWQSIEVEGTGSKAKSEHNLGPRFAHSAVYLSTLRSEKRSRKTSGFILVYGGYISTEDRSPCALLHSFDVRNRRWALRSPQKGIEPPPRAYHAAAVTDCLRYLVVHGGTCSDLEDHCFLSPDLFLFDIDESEWFLPQVLANSAEPASARQQHCIVNGVGKHKSSLILFGGRVSTGSFSNELFIIRIVKPANPNQRVSVVWEKHHVYPPPPSALEIPGNNENDNQENDGCRTAGAAGCMLAVPALNRYLFVGGRFSKGLRTNPLLLDASEVEHLDRLPDGTSSRRASNYPSPQVALVPLDPTSSKKSPTASRPASGRTSPSQEKIEWKKEKENRSSSLKRPRAKLQDVPPPPPVAAIPDAALSDTKAAGNAKANNTANPDTQKTADDPIAPPANLILSQDDGESSYLEVKPATEVRVKSASSLGKRRDERGECSDDSEVIDLVDDADGDQNAPLTKDLETPPSKKRRFMNGEQGHKSGKVDKMRIASDEGEADPIPVSGGSDFLAASELARRGKSRAVRGKGRGRGGANSKAKGRASGSTQTYDLKRVEELETLQKENTRVIESLQKENQQLREEKFNLSRDNKDLNKQMKSLLAEVKSLRAYKSRQRAEESRRKNRTVLGEPLSSNDDADEVATPSQTMEFRLPDTDQVSSLRSRVSDLEEECEEVGAERDALSKSLRDAEEGKRGLETEVHMLKNKISKQETEKETLRQQAADLRSAATEANVARENAVKQARKEEEVNVVLKRDIETLRFELQSLESKSVEHNVEMSSNHREMNKMKAQLIQVQKKYEQVDSKERLLKEEVGTNQEKLGELKKLCEELETSKQKLEQSNVQLVSELENVKKNMDVKQNEYEMMKQQMEKLRVALDKEKKEGRETCLEMARLKREVVCKDKVCDKLRDVVKQRDRCFQQIAPQLQRVMSQIGEEMCSSVDVEEGEGEGDGDGDGNVVNEEMNGDGGNEENAVPESEDLEEEADDEVDEP